MDLHLVGGFLGSGKTTAIIGAARLLLSRGRRVGVVTNDQGRFLVDTAFFAAADVATAEVAGGCFCCRYDELASVIRSLERQHRPEVVLAEAVGSCADLVATVVKPLAAERLPPARLRSYSVFTDIRLLERWLLGEPLRLSPNVRYIMEKQIEEAETLVANKADLLTGERLDRVTRLAGERFPGKRLLVQNSLDPGDLEAWLDSMETDAGLPDRSLDIDYQRYGAGEAELGWMDCVVQLLFPREGDGQKLVQALLDRVMASLESEDLEVAHLKILIRGEAGESKISVTSADDRQAPPIPPIPGRRAELIFNSRAQGRAEDVGRILRGALDDLCQSTGLVWGISEEEAFQPSFPQPQHRL